MVPINRKEKEEIRIVKIVCLIHINRAGIVRIEACEDTTIKDSIKSEFRYVSMEQEADALAYQ